MTAQPQILFYPGGGLGDTVVSLPILYAIHEFFGVPIDIVTTQNADALKEIYYGVPFIGDVIPCAAGMEFALGEAYDVMALANELVNIQVKENAQPYAPDFVVMAQRGLKRREAFGLVNRVANMLNNQLGNQAVLMGLDRRSLPLYGLGMDHYDETVPTMQLYPGALNVIKQHGLAPGGYITVQDGWDANFPLSRPGQRPTKVWSSESWAALVAEIKKRHPDKKILQLGSPKTGADIAGVDLNLRGKTPLRDSLAILKYAALHIDTEGGLVHMARGLHTQSLVLFGPTNAKFFGYPRNVNLVPPCNNCWWITNEWMSDCLRGLEVPECMISHKPAAVADEVSKILASQKPLKGTAVAGIPPVAQGAVGVANDTQMAVQFASTGCEVMHFDLQIQKNIQRKIPGISWKQYVARPGNLPVENETLDQLYFTANANAEEAAVEILEALRALKIGGRAIIKTTGDMSAAFAQAGVAISGMGETIILTREAA